MLCDLLLSLSTRFSRFIGHVRMYQYSKPFCGCIIFHCMHAPHYVHPLEFSWTPSTFCLLWIAFISMWLHMDLSARSLLYTSFILFCSSSSLLLSHRFPRVHAGETNNYQLLPGQPVPKTWGISQGPSSGPSWAGPLSRERGRVTEFGVNTHSPVCAQSGHGFTYVQNSGEKGS